MTITKFGPLVLSHLECDLDQKLIISSLLCEECKAFNMLKLADYLEEKECLP